MVWTNAHLGREAGAFYGRRRWLSAYRPGDLAAAAAITTRAEADRMAVVWVEGSEEPAPPGWARVGADRRVGILGSALYERMFVQVTPG